MMKRRFSSMAAPRRTRDIIQMPLLEDELAEFEKQIEAFEAGELESLRIMGPDGVTVFMKITLQKFKLFEAAINRLAERLDRLEK